MKVVKKNQQHIKIFNMWMFCITLKERNTKRFVQNWHSPVTFDRMVMVFYRTLFAIGSWIIAISKGCLIKNRNSHCLYAHKLYFVMPENCFRSGKSCTKFSNSEVSFQHFKLNNAIYMPRVPSLFH